MGANESAGVSLFSILTHTFSGYIVLLLPVVMLVFEFLLSEKVKPTIIYLVGGVLGAICTFLSTILYININVAGGNEYASAEVKTTYQIGFWLELLVFLAIVVITIVKDFALDKNAIQEKGLSNALKDVTSQVANEAISATSEIRSIRKEDFNFDAVKEMRSESVRDIIGGDRVSGGSTKSVCSNCGARVDSGTKFCAKCGTKVELSEVVEHTTVNATESEKTEPMKRVHKSKSEMTVTQVLARVKDVACENCGTKVGAGNKFCPDCGEKIVIKIPPKNCVKCGAALTVGKKFCPDCGEKIVSKELQTHCLNCSAELLFGKKFCVECGTKIED